MRKLFGAVVSAVLLGTAAPASAAWNEAISKHFHVYADEDPQRLREFATKLERFDAAVREARGTGDVPPGASTQVSVFVLRDIAAIRKIYGDPQSGVAGFYSPRAQGSVAFVPEHGEIGKFELGADNIFFHEYTHHLMFEATDAPMPTWLTEGFAEFFASPMFNPDGSVTVGAPPKYRAEALYDTGMGTLPLEKMLTGDYQYLTPLQFESLYARGWLLTHLLAFDPARRGQLNKYLSELANGTPPLRAAQLAFGDLKQLDRQLDQYFKTDKFTVLTIPASKLHLPPIDVRPLSPAMAALMDDRIKLARGGDKLLPAVLARHARSVVADHPDDVGARVLLSQLEAAAKDYSDAANDADAALKLDGKNEQAMLAKGAAMLELGKQQPNATNWDAIRAVLAEANRLDTEDAEPLILFYRTFAAQGVHPTANSIEDLNYALLLAPNDFQLRLEYVGQMIRDQRFAEAHEALIPIAYSPHTGKAHDAVGKVLASVDAKNGAQALIDWDAAKRLFDDD